MINELRLGNYLQNSGNLVKVVRLDLVSREPGVVSIEKLPGQHVNVYRNDPIPITEEWLLRLGFVEDKIWKAFFFKDVLSVELCNGIAKYDMPNSEIIIRYVHQLQNLYFALTGEELEIKEL